MDYDRNNIGFLFDLDGVLIDSEKEYSRIWAQINREFPTGINNLESIIKGCTLPKILSDFFPENIRGKVALRLHELENKMHYEFLPFAHEFLNELKERKIRSALVTSSDNVKMNHLWEELPELKHYFDYIVTGDQVKTSKPSPEGYLLAAEKINCDIKNCIVFEDSLQGVMAGKNSGALVVSVIGTLPKETLAPYSHILIESFNELNIENLIRTIQNEQ